jgi:hypothetical protein
VNAEPSSGISELAAHIRCCTEDMNGYTLVAALAQILCEDLNAVAEQHGVSALTLLDALTSNWQNYPYLCQWVERMNKEEC